MDILSILTRSTRHAKASQNPSTAPRLPSSGQNANPQLFANGDVPEPVTKKRRLSHSEENSLPAELDFFGQGSDAHEANKQTDNGATSKKRKRKSKEQLGEGVERRNELEVERMSKEECKRLLRAHKIKITVLEDPVVEEERRRKEAEKLKEKKKKKRKKDEIAEVPKKEAKKLAELYPQPLRSFSVLAARYGVAPRLVRNLEEQEYKIPTEIQLGALPLLLDQESGGDGRGMDLLSVAPTGSGKTLAFLIPAIKTVLELKSSDIAADDQARYQKAKPTVLVIAPTKELAAQIVNEGRKLSNGLNVKLALMKKGMEVIQRDTETQGDSRSGSESEDESGSDDDERSPENNSEPRQSSKAASLVKADILVSTPLILLNALKSGDSVAHLLGVRNLVLDEADVLLDPLFRDQTLAIWKACTNPSLQSSLWSATMGSNIESLVQTTLSTINPARTAPLIRIVIGLKDTAVPNISHTLTYCASEAGKLLEIRNLLRPPAVASTRPSLRPPFLIFTQTIPRALALEAELRYDIPPEAGGSTRIAVLHAQLSDTIRAKTLARFRNGEVWVLVTTDLLARGVDFRGLNGVVNYDVPNSPAAYVHRVGRTGRAGREGGVAVTLWAKEDIPHIRSIANVIVAAEKQCNGTTSDGGNASETQKLIDKLPTPSKKEKQELKRAGVEARRPNAFAPGKRGKDEGKKKWENREANVRISTKSGFDKKIENRRREARMSGRRERQKGAAREGGRGKAEEDDFEGFSD